MGVEKPAYEELEARLARAERIIEAIRSEQVDAIIGENKIYLIRLREMEEALKRAKEELETRVQERTAELEALNLELQQEVELRKKSEDDRKNLSRRLLEVQETERRNIAFDLHDSIGSSLSGIKMAMELKLNNIQTGKTISEGTTLEEILNMITKCIRDTKRIQHDLRPSVLDLLGLPASLRSLCNDFANTCSIKADCTLAIDGAEVPENLQIIIYRISQEALNNAAKYSRAKHVSFSLVYQEGKIQLKVRDDGCGFDPEQYLMPDENRTNFGLSSMRERCELSGGDFSIHSRIGEGSEVCASWASE
ncbi:MAG: ATP-binding protein [Thermodesulfobacteriota bacterium]